MCFQTCTYCHWIHFRAFLTQGKDAKTKQTKKKKCDFVLVIGMNVLSHFFRGNLFEAGQVQRALGSWIYSICTTNYSVDPCRDKSSMGSYFSVRWKIPGLLKLVPGWSQKVFSHHETIINTKRCCEGKGFILPIGVAIHSDKKRATRQGWRLLCSSVTRARSCAGSLSAFSYWSVRQSVALSCFFFFPLLCVWITSFPALKCVCTVLFVQP